jgi:hypothetical protein
MKNFTPNYTPVYSNYSKLPVLTDFSQATLQPEEILEHRLVKKGNAALLQVRVKWSGLSAASVT